VTTFQNDLKMRLADASAEVRRRAVLEIPSLGDADFAEMLIQSLGDPDWRVRKEAAAIAASSTNRDDVITALIAATEEEENIGLRNAALNALSLGGIKAIDRIIERATLPNPDVRKTAIDILGLSRDQRAVAVLRLALSDADTNVRVAAAEWLGEYRDTEATEALLSCLEVGNSLLNLVALQSLEKLGARAPWDHIAPLLDEPLLNEVIVPILGASGASEAVPAVAKFLMTDPGACLAMTQLHDASDTLAILVEETLKQSGPETQEALWRWNNEEKGEVERAALRCIVWMKQPETIPQLVSLARNSRHYPVLVEELGKWGDPVVEILKAMLRTETDHRLASVVGLLYRLLDDAAGRMFADDFESLLLSEHSAVATAAASAVARFGDETAIPKLMDLIGSPSERIRNAAGCALSELANQFPDAVHEAVHHKSVTDPAGVQLCRVLEKVGTESDAETVSLALRSSNSELRRSAVKTLARIWGIKSISRIGEALSDSELGVRMAAVDALAGIGAPAAETIASALIKAEGPVAPALVRALGKVGHPDAARILEEACLTSGDVALAAIEAAGAIGVDLNVTKNNLLRHADKEVVKAALRAFGGAIPEEELSALIGHPEWDVRLAAVKEIGKRPSLLAALRRTMRQQWDIEDNDLVRSAIADLDEELKEHS
jgi:HEAT repeat protein